MRRVLLASEARSIHTRRWATALARNGWDVHVATLRSGAIEDATVHVIAPEAIGRAGYWCGVPSIRKLVRRLDPTIIHAHYLTSYGAIVAAARVRPVVVTAWGSDLLIAPGKSHLHRELVRFSVRAADAVTLMAEHMRPAAQALGVGAAKTYVIPFGVDVEAFVPAPEHVEEDLIVCTRSLAPIYDVDVLVRALGILHARGVRFRAELVGDGPLRGVIANLVRELGLSDKVAMAGAVPHERLPGILSRAAVFVSPARSDGNNISLNEAMACGCFPVATAIPANAQWIDHRRSGMLFAVGDPADLARCLEAALGDPGLRGVGALLNRGRVERDASWAVAVQKMTELYENIIRSSACA